MPRSPYKERQTLEDLHHGLRRAFRWDDDHLYSFWLSGVHWDSLETEFTAPFDGGESSARSAEVKLASLGLQRTRGLPRR